MEDIFKESSEETKEQAPAEKPIKKKRKKSKQTWNEWFGTDEAVRIVYLVFGLLAITLLMILLQFSTGAVCCGDFDGYYHIRWSQLIWENLSQGKWLPEFTWLPLTVLNPADYADHHFLFHLLQIPFLWFFEPVMAAKLSTVFYGSLAIFSVYWLMYRYKVDYMLLWLGALLTCANSFFFRINMAKAPPLTIIYTIVGIYLFFERKYVWLLPLMFVFVWTYSLFPMLLIGAIIWTIIIAWNERFFEWRPLAYTSLGMVLGNVINPYFPNNLILFWEHFYTKFKIGSDFAVSVGGEWYPYDGLGLLMNLPIALLAMLIGYIFFVPRDGKLPEKATFFLVFTTILLAAQFRSKRFAEYFPPFAILFAAFSLRSFTIPTTHKLPEDLQLDLEVFLDTDKKTEKQETYAIAKQIALWLLGLGLVAWMTYNFAGIDLNRFGIQFKESGLITTIKNNDPDNKYKGAMDWANANIPEGERIFNSNWDDFPKMFFYDQKHNYVFGLDPNYLYSENKELYQLIKPITSGKEENPAPIIRDKFKSRWIFTDKKENEDMVANCLESGWCEKVYDDEDAIILKIRDEKVEPEEKSDEGEEEATSDEEEPAETPAEDEPTADEEVLDEAAPVEN